ncbi:MAG TPA: hypothetical protein VHI98_09030 [Vicinamibacterales bacterium]|jgi:hypothetical protein|nr:hypothetical protein [Vicinamibacterales bacterium]
MSNGSKKKINIQPAHEALGKLLQDLRTVDLKPLSPRGTAIPDSDLWLATLEKTHTALREWCDGFILEAQIKR